MNEELIASLKELLANTYTVYLKAHGYHWNVEGKNFPQYHEFFETIYSDLYGSVDDTAENIRKLGGYAPFSIARFAGLRTIQDSEVSPDCESMSMDLYASMQQLIASNMKAFELANQANEQGIADFLAGRDDMLKKWSWQLRSSLKD